MSNRLDPTTRWKEHTNIRSFRHLSQKYAIPLVEAKAGIDRVIMSIPQRSSYKSQLSSSTGNILPSAHPSPLPTKTHDERRQTFPILGRADVTLNEAAAISSINKFINAMTRPHNSHRVACAVSSMMQAICDTLCPGSQRSQPASSNLRGIIAQSPRRIRLAEYVSHRSTPTNRELCSFEAWIAIPWTARDGKDSTVSPASDESNR
ncbi:hypothetical protein K470DRAFT_156789 [Piedraia hortae CBS 480.64]|uniref:Uncharacterized protein n=1 Tax=Piedraia hortae CBS 480.64 TaxID=1314780 RepID=A0A6A7BSW8_9PEZI|nr:hypothetical protein K470DRAFT_156789 [Piedraia hortae CBS 480.64]